MTIELNTLSYILLTTIFSAASVVIIKHGEYPDVHPVVVNSQGEFSPLRYAGESATIKAKLYPNGAPILTTINRPIATLSDLYQVALTKHSNTNVRFLGTRNPLQKGKIDWHLIMAHFVDGALGRVQSIYSGLIHIANLKPSTESESSFVGIYTSTSPDAFVTEIACHWGGLVCVPIAAQATSSHILHVIRNTLLTVLVIDETHLEFVLQLIEGTTVKHLVIIGQQQEDDEYSKQDNYLGVTVTLLSSLESLGSKNLVERSDQVAFDSIASIYYTSRPKHNVVQGNDHNPLGVVLTHKNIISVISSYLFHLPGDHKITSEDRLMHGFAIDNVLGYVLQAILCYVGGSIVFEDKLRPNEYTIDIPSVLPTIEELKPTIYASGGPFLKQAQKLIANTYGNSFLFQRGLERKELYHKEGRLLSDCIYDMLVFRDIRQRMFGGKIRLLIMDDDDIPKTDLSSFYRSILGAQVIKTFSQPETSSSMTATIVYDYTHDKRVVGPPLACMEIKLTDAKKEGYTAEDLPNPRGEIRVRGHNVFVGYWNDIATSMDVIDPDGWYSTGMIGELLPNGCLMVLGPKDQSP